MTLSRRQMLGHSLGAAMLPSFSRIAFADDAYPSRPLRLIVGFTPGSASDVVGRFFAKGASTALGQQVVVENKPGAGSAIAAKYAAAAEPARTAISMPSNTRLAGCLSPSSVSR